MEQSYINKEIEQPDERLVSLVCSNMLNEPSYYQTNNEKITNLVKTLNEVYQSDPELILQLAYYTRNHMNLRSTPNFLLAYASIRKNTKTLLKNYFRGTIKLPTDLLEVVELSQVLKCLNFQDGKSLPKIDAPEWKLFLSRELTECIKYKFSDFTEYQLGKYCSDGKRKREVLKKKRHREVLLSNQIKEDDDFNEIEKDKIDSKYKLNGNVLKFKKKKELDEIENATQKMKVMCIRQRKKFLINNKELIYKSKQESYLKSMLFGVKEHREYEEDQDDGEDKNEDLEQAKTGTSRELKKVNMKRIVKICKIQQPSLLVNKILNRRYPQNEEDFKHLLSENNGILDKLAANSKKFDPSKAGKKMKLEIPSTWETRLSKEGNKKEVWEDLINRNELPIMATIRNLRNLVRAELSEETQKKIIERLTDYNTIANSKILPFQFYSAFRQIKNLYDNQDQPENCTRFGVRFNKKNSKKNKTASPKVEKSKIKNYIDALETSISISTMNSVSKIPGKVLVFTDTSGSMESPLSTLSTVSMKDCGILLGLMLNFSSEECEFRIFSSPGRIDKSHILVNVDKNYIFKNFEKIYEDSKKLGGGTEVPIDRLLDALNNKEVFDYIFIISDMMISGPNYDELANFLKEYREKVNPLMRFIAINLFSYGKTLNTEIDSRDLMITGFSEKIFNLINDDNNVTQVKKVKEACKQELEVNTDN